MSDNISLTSTEAVAQAVGQYTDRDTIVTVQRALLSKGYVDGGPADGILSQKTRDEILAFRARNNLQLIPIIDDELLRSLEVAPPKALPVAQVTATKADIKPQVEIVQVNDKVKKLSWWGQFWAWLTGLPAALLTLLAAIINNIDSATSAIQPIKNLLYGVQDIPTWIWLVTIIAIASIFAYQQMKIAALAKQLEEKAVEGYQRGTLKNDLPPVDPD